LWRLRGEHPIWRKVEVRTCKYLNNIVEQDPYGPKTRTRSSERDHTS
jgi:transposase-like protein